MLFSSSEKASDLLDQVRRFMAAEVSPVEHLYREQASGENRYRTPAIVQELKARAKAAGLWNLFLPGDHGAGLTNLEYAPLAEEMGRVLWASEVFNCAAPDTGNMEILHMFVFIFSFKRKCSILSFHLRYMESFVSHSHLI